ncbi:MAG: hypothetical protein L0G11_06265 [Chryseobacterium sp.]|nr:hypothetical protein [Chryseobacterium sp.]
MKEDDIPAQTKTLTEKKGLSRIGTDVSGNALTMKEFDSQFGTRKVNKKLLGKQKELLRKKTKTKVKLRQTM